MGVWEGALDFGPMKLRLAFKIDKKADGGLSAKMDSIDQGAKDIPVKGAKFEDNKLTLDLSDLQAEFIGTLGDDGVIKGEWKQAGRTFPLTLKRVEKASELKRPQVPVKPYPYDEEDVTVENTAANVKLAGTLTKPKTAGPHPAVVMITGSGAQDRDESLMGHKPFLIIADHLTRRGIAVLRCDDRGVFKSTGNHKTATTADFATDVYACVKFLRSRKDIDPKRIGLIGHSEGGLIGPIVAAEHPDEVAFVVMLAGPGLPGDEILAGQVAALSKAGGSSEEHTALRVAMQRKLLAIAKQGGDSKELTTKLASAAKEYVDGLPEADRKNMKAESGIGEKQLAGLTSPWMIYFLQYDPRPTLKKVKCPVLALNGEKDIQVTPKENLAAVGKALAEGGNKNVTLREFPGLNHLFQHATTGLPTEYGNIEETFAPEALEAVAKWILALK